MLTHFWLNQEAISSYHHHQATKVFIIKAMSWILNTHKELMEGIQATTQRLQLHPCIFRKAGGSSSWDDENSSIASGTPLSATKGVEDFSPE
jgi:hypothetical protein